MKRLTVYLAFVLLTLTVAAQGVVEGTVYDSAGVPLPYVNIGVLHTSTGTTTDYDGHYRLKVTRHDSVTLRFSYTGYRQEDFRVKVAGNMRLDVHLRPTAQMLKTVEISDDKTRQSSFTTVDVARLDDAVGPAGGVEGIIKMLPDVQSNNELSSQYSVRGGSFDENLVYINGIEVFRPMLIRSAQQEGMSIINPDLVDYILFSPGGFDASYGDKLSSVLDITYSRPDEFRGKASVSLLGATLSLQGRRGERFSYAVGARQHSNSYVLGSLDTKGRYSTNYTDLQALFNYRASDRLDFGAMVLLTRNVYGLVPESQTTTFGGFYMPLSLRVYFDGQEVDRYQNYLGGLTFLYKHNDNNQLRLILSSYYSKESETYDILAQYWLNDIRFGGDGEVEIGDLMGYGSYLEHARNNLSSVVSAADIQGTHNLPFRNKLEWGVKAQNEYIRDHIKEWTMLDSSGYTLPYIPTTPGEIVVQGDPARLLDFGENNYLVSNNTLNTWRITGFVQDTWKIDGDSANRFTLTGGLRMHYWTYSKREFTVSPRLAFLYKPRWRQDWRFSLRTGLYYQPAFYREMRYPDGTLNPDIRSQRSAQVVAGGEYRFMMWRRPFKFTAEAYYKYLDRLITYNVDNVQIIYNGENNAKGYAAGLDLRLSGEFVRGLESWFSVSLMSTMEDVIGDYTTDADGNQVEVGYIPRPTDQRVAFNLFFQDHIPSFPQFRVHLNFVFASGLPYGPPKAEPAMRKFRTPWYRRVDLGLSFMLLEQSRDRMKHKSAFLRSIKNAGIYVEVFNLLGTYNVSSYMWVTDIYNYQRPIPTYLTGRLINVKLIVEW